MSAGNDSIMGAFLYETNTLLEQLDSIVLEAEQADNFSEDDVNSIFRIMHTVKGASAMMEFNSLMKIAHRAEDMFAIVREKSIDIVPENLRPELFDLLFKTIDFFREEIENIENSRPLTENIDTLLEKVNSFIEQIENGGSANATPNAKPETSDDVSQNKVDSANNLNVSGFDFPFGLLIHFEEGTGMENLRATMVVNSVKDICDASEFTTVPADTSPADEIENIIKNGFLILFKSEDMRDACIPVVASTSAVASYEKVTPPQPSEDSAGEVETNADNNNEEPALQKAAAAPPANVVAKAPPTVNAKESLISVNLSKLDQLAAVVGEIVITESMVTSSPDIKNVKLDAFTKSARQLRKLTDELQDVSMSLRMIPVSATFQKMNRIVRDMSKKLGKQVHLTLIGADTEVDKTIVDTIGDPIMHIVRNSMDHGIEKTPQDRIDAGKNPTGEIVLSATHTGSEVIIEIKDDGKGVDCDAVLNKAIRKGIAFEGVDYSEKEILQMLLAPGFSTNAQVTEFSGRGVGMDVAKQNVESVGGTVSIKSEKGKGMCTTLKIPLTMAIMDGMEVSVGGGVYTIPIQSIRQSFKISSDDIITDASGGEMYRCLGTFYPVVRMRDVYQIEGGYTNFEDGILVWLDTGEFSYCLFVDELLGEQQVVVKPLPNYLNKYKVKSSGISGCTILGDGNISLILDASNIYSPPASR